MPFRCRILKKNYLPKKISIKICCRIQSVSQNATDHLHRYLNYEGLWPVRYYHPCWIKTITGLVMSYILWGLQFLLRHWWQRRLHQTFPRLFSGTLSYAEGEYTPPSVEDTAGHTRHTLSLHLTDRYRHTRPITAGNRRQKVVRLGNMWVRLFLCRLSSLPADCWEAAVTEGAWQSMHEKVLQKDPGWR